MTHNILKRLGQVAKANRLKLTVHGKTHAQLQQNARAEGRDFFGPDKHLRVVLTQPRSHPGSEGGYVSDAVVFASDQPWAKP